MDYILTSIILCIIALIMLNGISVDENAEWMSASYTTALKAIACIIVVFVHIPTEYGNKLQDMVGSFAYVGVTIFTMISAYGCRAGIDRGADYLKSFWKNRLLALAIPLVIYNIIFIPLELVILGISAFKFNFYIRAIVTLYFIFWLVWKVKFIPHKYKDIIISCIIVMGSLLTYFTEFDIF